MSTYSALEQQILALINQYRGLQGMPELHFDDQVQAACRKHSQAMAQGALPFGHDGFKERAEGLLQSLRGTGIAENVAQGQDSADAVVRSWLNSEGHRKNIEGSYQATGIAAEQDASGKFYFTQIFLRVPQTQSSTTTTTMTTVSGEALEKDLMDKIQAYRQSKGLSVFQTHTAIDQAAQRHAQAMASGSLPFGHDGFQERAMKLMKQLQSRNAGENIAVGNAHADEILNGWIQSEPHRKNLEGAFGYAGLGAAQGKDGRWYFTQIFIK